jgi:hypothetical protein
MVSDGGPGVDGAVDPVSHACRPALSGVRETGVAQFRSGAPAMSLWLAIDIRL